jgi:hypothetical protein
MPPKSPFEHHQSGKNCEPVHGEGAKQAALRSHKFRRVLTVVRERIDRALRTCTTTTPSRTASRSHRADAEEPRCLAEGHPDQARADAERAEGAIEQVGPAITPLSLGIGEYSRCGSSEENKRFCSPVTQSPAANTRCTVRTGQRSAGLATAVVPEVSAAQTAPLGAGCLAARAQVLPRGGDCRRRERADAVTIRTS